MITLQINCNLYEENKSIPRAEILDKKVIVIDIV
jgi:hypothetical protein